jgi:hypothetical protein
MNHRWLPTRRNFSRLITAAACMVVALGATLPATAADRMVLCEEFTNTE